MAADTGAKDSQAAARPLSADVPVQPAHASAEDDARCVAAVLSGQRERFSELIERYQNAVFAVVRGYVRDRHAAEDATQDIFIQAFSALKQLQQPRLFLPWILTIARHHSVRAGQSDRKRSKQVALSGDETRPPPDDPVHERVSHVLAKVEELPEPYRQTVLAKYQRNMSCKEIAEDEGVAIGTITSRLTRALAMLRNALNKGS